MQHIPLIALTGGPCAGKSSAMTYLVDNLRDIGITAVIAQEQATNYFTSGISIPELLSVDGGIDRFQTCLATAIINEEEGKRGAAAILPGKRKVVLCDRGLLDNAAYMDKEALELLLYELGISREEALARYEAVFHLVTAAEGAEKHYNLANEARTETPEEARQLDLLTREAWLGHEHLVVVPNIDANGGQIDFDGKLRDLYQGVCHALGIPTPLEIERKFLLKPRALQEFAMRNLAVSCVDIRQVYLKADEDGVERRLRARMGYGGQVTDRGSTYTYTEKRDISDLVRNESSRLIGLREYVGLERDEADPGRNVIRKSRYNFMSDYTYFHMDAFHDDLDGLVLMEVEFTDESEVLALPDWLSAHVISEVTDDPNFRNSSLAQKGAVRQ